MNLHILAATLVISVSLGTAGLAHDHAATTDAIQPADPQLAIPEVMKALFETPDNPLSVTPVVVAGDWAVADWSQGDKGGRALLKHGDKGWAIHLCSGASLKDAKALQQIGIAQSQAQSLAAGLARAEAALSHAHVALYDSFEGTMLMEH
jgi:periplasmic copper chaperone A